MDIRKTEIKILAGILIVAVLSLAITPVPAYAGNVLGGISIIGIVLGIIATILCYGSCVGLVAAALGASAAVVTAVTVVSYVATAGILGMQSYTASTCSGNYDPIFGTCTTSKNISQQIFTTSNAKFTNIDMNVPSPEEFDKNPNATVTVGWQADAHPGLVNYLAVSDKDSGTYVPASIGPNGNVCSAGPQNNVYSLPYSKTYIAKIWFASCWQIRSKRRGAVPVCSGCGSDVVGAEIEFTTPTLPPLGVDIKANGKDGGSAFVPGTPIALSWMSQYATSCSAEDSWSGSKSVSGTEQVTPTIGNEVYTIVCTRPDGSTAQDSVSAAVSPPGFQISTSSSPLPNGSSSNTNGKPFLHEVIP